MKKNLTIQDLKRIKKNSLLKKKKIVLCHGVFDLIHIGHIKHFTSAKKLGDILVVSLTPDQFVNKGPGRPIFSQNLRSEFLQNILSIDYIIVNNKPTSINIIKQLKPDIYCKGSDYVIHKNDVTGEIRNEIKALKQYGGIIKYTNEITNSSSKLINEYYSNFSLNQKKTIKNIKSKKIDFNKLLESSRKLKVLVLGEIIIDQYFFCETLGKSGKDPVLQMHEQNTENYLGGAAAIAGNVSQFAGKVTLMSMIGENKEYLNFIKKKLPKNINLKLIYKKNSPTVIKKKYVEIITNNKVFGSYIINDSPLEKSDEKKLNTFLDKNLKKYDLVIVSDYGHGFVSDKNAHLISKKSKFLALNAQINAANRGYHTMEKYKNLNCVIINETELRHELRDKNSKINSLMIKLSGRIGIKDLIVTMGSQGATLFNKNSKKFYDMEAFATKIVDKIGSGDTMLSLIAILLKLRFDKTYSLLVSSLAASQSVGSMGNKNLINKIKLVKAIDHTLK